MPLLFVGGVLLAVELPATIGWLIAGVTASVAAAVISWWWPEGRAMPKAIASPGYFVWSNVAGLMAWLKFFRGERNPIWEPTRRPDPPA